MAAKKYVIQVPLLNLTSFFDKPLLITFSLKQESHVDPRPGIYFRENIGALDGAQYLSVPADDSCLFHAMGFIIYGRGYSHTNVKKLREDAVKYVVQHFNDSVCERMPLSFLTATANNVFNDRAAYQDFMTKESSYGGTAELYALCRIHHCTVTVVLNGNPYERYRANGTVTWPNDTTFALRDGETSSYLRFSGDGGHYEPMLCSMTLQRKRQVLHLFQHRHVTLLT